MKAIKALLAIAVMATALAAVVRTQWMRYECDREKGRADRRLRQAFRDRSESERAAVGRRLLARLRPCLEHDPFDYQLLVTYGIAADASGRKDLALEMYTSALALNERPEILANIAELQFELGRPAEAKANLLRAASFHIAYVRKVGEPLRSELVAAVQARNERLLAAATQGPQDDAEVGGERP
jgi:tetratricopeptide (TPR) repeat protein